MQPSIYRLMATVATGVALASPAAAQVFDAGLPPSWECQGNCGTAETDGDVWLAPGGGERYGWVSNHNGVAGVRLPGVGVPRDSFNGSLLRSHAFSAGAGQVLSFQLNYVTTDGGDFSDYGWVRLLDAGGNQVAMLVTARTSPGGGAVPGFGMPAGAATLDPPYSNVLGPAPVWSPLGPDSGTCYVEPCGVTDWIGARYTIAASGQYRLEFGVVNWVDASSDTGMAFDAIELDGRTLPAVPEPAGATLLAAGVAVLALRQHLRGRLAARQL
ncbi:NF038132 family protein [[Empedobacter] haloabium]|uniref:NF038132 family protein n=1 Tax=[Empedobacter] haloabium TaxID=592317 RepID=A0ABZ1URC2_9BURK